VDPEFFQREYSRKWIENTKMEKEAKYGNPLCVLIKYESLQVGRCYA
jgi:hypothetical protein